MSKGIVVLSGGQDSCTCLFIAKAKHGSIDAITFDYGQRHATELASAKTVALLAGVEQHEILELGPILHGKSPLTDFAEDLEEYDSYEEMTEIIGERVELTFVPLRNALFLTLALNRAAVAGIYHVYTGVSACDSANYPDTRRSFIKFQEKTAQYALGQENAEKKIKIHTPLIDIPKAQSIDLALTYLNCYATLGFSHTAYSGEYPATTPDHATVLRAHGFKEAEVPDPLVVRAYWEGLSQLPSTDNYLSFGKEIDRIGGTKDGIIEKLGSLEEYVRSYKAIVLNPTHP